MVLDRDTLVRLKRSRDFLAETLDTPVSLADAAREACFSPFHYHRLFSNAFGHTPHEFVTRERVERAKFWLRTTDRSVSDICLEVGYGSLGTFSTMFHRTVGCSPSEYRRQAARFFQLGKFWSPHFVPTCYLTRND